MTFVGYRQNLQGDVFPTGDVTNPLRSGATGMNQPMIAQESEYGIREYDTAGTLREGRIPEHQMVVAAPLSHGSNPNLNRAGRRREDDENLVLRVGNTSADPLVRTPGITDALDQGTGHGHSGYANQAIASFDAEMSYHEPDDLAYLTRKLKSEATGVRRLTPTECERLQALPDGWTDFGPDSRRYAALGDAVTASVAEWIGRRILQDTAQDRAGVGA